MNGELIEHAAGIIKNSHMTVALTGAGTSVPSGIPDFRSPGSGLWEKVDPIEVATIDSFRRNPARFYEFMAPLAKMIMEAPVNPAHRALAEWESMGLLKTVITQNIDGLHQKAGSKNVLELHGNGDHMHCLECNREYSPEEAREKYEREGVPYCECGGVIKPDVILFGEALPFKTLMQAERDSEGCDVMVVIGSSLTVAPASMLPQAALSTGSTIIVINLQETYMDRHAAVAIHDNMEEVLPAITEAIRSMN